MVFPGFKVRLSLDSPRDSLIDEFFISRVNGEHVEICKLELTHSSSKPRSAVYLKQMQNEILSENILLVAADIDVFYFLFLSLRFFVHFQARFSPCRGTCPMQDVCHVDCLQF